MEHAGGDKKRPADELLDGDVQPTKSNMTDDPDVTTDLDIQMCLNMSAFDVDLAEWLMSESMDATQELNGVRQPVRLYGRGQQVPQAHVSEAYPPKRVTGMADIFC